MRFVHGRDLAQEVDRFYENASPTFDSVEFLYLLQKFISVCKTIAYRTILREQIAIIF